MRLLIAMVMAAVLLVPGVFAEGNGPQPTQQFNKIFLEPFYRASMTQNTNYTYVVAVSPPDGVSRVNSAIVNIDAWISPTRTFYAWVNGVACRNPDYVVSTTYATAGRAVATFDCGNVISKAGNYTVTLRVAGGNIGSSTAFLDLTYMNNPKGSMNVHGTEYRPGETATTWLQLKDAQGLPENSGACYLDVYAPSTGNVTRPEIVKMAPMLHRVGSEGIYYYEMIVPDQIGVYMNIASCSYQHSGVWVYDLDGEETNYPYKWNTTGTWVGSDIFINDFEDWIYTTCTSTGGGLKTCEATYDFNASNVLPGNMSNITNMDLYYMGEASVKATQVLSVYLWNNNTWYTLPNTLTFSGSATSVPIGIGDFVSNGLPLTNTVSADKIIRIRQTVTFGSNYNLYNNWLNIQLKTASGLIQDLKGSSEMHVNNWFNNLEGNATQSLNLLRQINATTNNTGTVVNEINTTVGAILTNVTSIKNDTSLISQIWTWVQSIFLWVQTDQDQNATTAVTIASDQSVKFVDAQYYMQQPSSVVASVQKGGLAVTAATCDVRVLYPNMTQQVTGAMTFTGIDGLYSYSWTPETYGSHYAQVNCSGGGLQGQAQASGSLGVSAPSSGVIMQSIG